MDESIEGFGRSLDFGKMESVSNVWYYETGVIDRESEKYLTHSYFFWEFWY